jgi:hypothetical protein
LARLKPVLDTGWATVLSVPSDDDLFSLLERIEQVTEPVVGLESADFFHGERYRAGMHLA